MINETSIDSSNLVVEFFFTKSIASFELTFFLFSDDFHIFLIFFS
ncbi:hypothetical protein N9L69_02300 [Candidatus Pelagibacter bacterium]|nr:hypothetical protein [Candidatus Pelagibacter bacterium]